MNVLNSNTTFKLKLTKTKHNAMKTTAQNIQKPE